MKYNTYDIPAIKFYVIYGENNIIDKITNNNPASIISFDDIDGLTIEGVRETIKHLLNSEGRSYTEDSIEDIYIVSLLDIKLRHTEKRNAIFNIEKICLNIRVHLGLSDVFANQRIDETIEEILLNANTNESITNDQRRVMKCFLQRYRYNTMEEVDEVLKTKTPKKRIRVPE